MAARIGYLRALHAVRGAKNAARKDRSSDIYLNSICQRCLSTTTNIYQKYFSKDHEWVDVENGIGKVGVTNHAQELLGELVFIELPEVEDEFAKDDTVGVVESVKSASDVMTPVSGTIVAINETLESAPETVNKDAEGGGWLFQIKLSVPSEVDDLLSEAEYKTFVAESEE